MKVNHNIVKHLFLMTFTTIILILLSSNIVYADKDSCKIDKYKEKDFSYLMEGLNGISEEQVKQHLILYKGYISKINLINDKIKERKDNFSYPEYRSLKIEQSFASNGVILHELYFLNLTNEKTAPTDNFKNLAKQSAGSFDNFINDIKASARNSRGWVFTGYNTRDNKLHNYIIDSHDLHVPVNVIPVLVIDVWEHAYMVDYGIDRDAYIESILKNIDWFEVEKRLNAALKP